MKQIRIAQIGLNRYSHSVQVFQSLCQQTDIFEVAGICLPENEKERLPHFVEKISPFQELSLEELLNDPTITAVAVETDEIYLTKYALLAAQHGKHIHMEKPGGTDPEQFELLIRTAKENRLVLHLGYMYRYNPAVTELIDRVGKGELGQIISVEAQMGIHHEAPLRQWLEDFPGGMMFFLGCHLVDLVLQLQGDPLRIIPLNKSTGVNGTTSEDFAMAVFEYPQGYSLVKSNATEYGGFLRRHLLVNGTKGTVEIRPLEYGPEKARQADVLETSEHTWNSKGISSTTAPFHRYGGMLRSFAAMARGETENPYTYDYELKLYKAVLKACGL